MSQSRSFAPGIWIDGVLKTPPGWMWTLSFALAGCEWALKIVDTPEFQESVRQSLLKECNKDIQDCIDEHFVQIECLKKELQ